MSFVEFTGQARLGKRTKNLVSRLGPDDVAIIDHQDIDRVSAEELLDSGVRVVVNVAQSQTGRFPNPGPLLLVRGGVRLIDAPGAPLFDSIADGELVTVRGANRHNCLNRLGFARSPFSGRRGVFLILDLVRRGRGPPAFLPREGRFSLLPLLRPMPHLRLFPHT